MNAEPGGGWGYEALCSHIQVQIDRIEALNRERGEQFQRQLDQRSAAQHELFGRRMDDADKAIQAALVSAEKAVGKAEVASEKRFEGINEFRGALSDQQRELLPRTEYRSGHDALVDRLAILSDRVSAIELRLTTRLERGEGSHAGATGQRTEQRLDTGLSLTAASVLIGFLIVAVSLYAALHK